jgi:hypothetical protein
MVLAYRVSERERLSYCPMAGGRGGTKTSLPSLRHSLRLYRKINTLAAIIKTRLVTRFIWVARKILHHVPESVLFAK